MFLINFRFCNNRC